MNKLTGLDWVALVLVVVGGVNWGLVGVADINLVELLFGPSLMAAVVYDLVGLAAVYLLLVSGKLARK